MALPLSHGENETKGDPSRKDQWDHVLNFTGRTRFPILRTKIGEIGIGISHSNDLSGFRFHPLDDNAELFRRVKMQG